jgi:hypothetical protein
MIHALLVEGTILRFEGDPFQVLEKMAWFEMQGKKVGYLFGAHTEEEFMQKARTNEPPASLNQ